MAKTEWKRCNQELNSECIGVGVFDLDGRGHYYEIEKCDECDRFETDEEAVQFVLDGAFAGDAECRRILTELAMGPHKSDCTVPRPRQ